MLDLSNLTLGEIDFIETKAEMSISAIGDENAPKGKLFAAIATVAKRRDGQMMFSYDDALKLPMDEVNTLLGLNEEETDEESKDES